ncbi:hypothetical protein Asp14428_32490 [Actinoplanes sp. NBRC 14428]|nr:hypothetical protein Asp14428_32490 [Actinoplanes sp. NBRC 14428]
MTSVQLALPDEILQEVNFPYDGVRDASGITLAVEGVNLTASIVTLAAIKQYAPRLASAIRRWRLHQDKDSIRLTVKGGGIDMTVDLPPNINTQRLLEQLTPLLEKD